MVRGMRIVIATAEPRAAYHLLPLAKALKESQNTFVHLAPYPEPVQGEAIMDVTSQLSVIKDCDRVVVTGGTLSAWTELVCRYASTLGKPVIYTQLANVTNTSPVAPRVSTALATALSMDGVDAVSRYLQMSDVSVTGTPALDELPAWNPVPKSALLLSTSEMTRRDPSLQLLAAAVSLRQHGWDVRVRTHPREDRTPWDAFDIIDGETQAESASSAQVVIGYPGSAHVLAAAVGVPVIALSPNEALASVFTERQAAGMSAHAQSATEVLSVIDSVHTPDPLLVAAVVGPLGGASQRIVNLWTGPLPDTSNQ
jgi:hypothetical protein